MERGKTMSADKECHGRYANESHKSFLSDPNLTGDTVVPIRYVSVGMLMRVINLSYLILI